MPNLKEPYALAADVVLGVRLNEHLPAADQSRQRAEADEILCRLRQQPGVILADEVGMGKTFVALAVAYSVAAHNPRGPVIIMVPPNLVQKWAQDLKAFCELYLDDRLAVGIEAPRKERTAIGAVRYGIARHSIELLKLLDDPPRERCHVIFLAQGAMNRRQSDKWIRLALIAEALRRHGRGGASRLIQVKKQIHRFMGRLLWALGDERAHGEGEALWQKLLKVDTSQWREIYNRAVHDSRRALTDDPVPKTIARRLHRIDLNDLAEALKAMPVRARGGEVRVHERINHARKVLRQVEESLWKIILAEARWRSPLLVMDEAHHLKNPGTSLARQLQSPESASDLRTGDGAMAQAFERMLFLTATPFQLGHSELVSVLRRFGDIRWDNDALGDQPAFFQRLRDLENHLNSTQRAAIALQRCWGRLQPEDCGPDGESWWRRIRSAERETLSSRERAVVEAFETAHVAREQAELHLRPWIVRHDKGALWSGTAIARRRRLAGAAAVGGTDTGGLPVPSEQLLSFFLAARSAVSAGQDLLGEALCSSYEAFRLTRQNRDSDRDELDDSPETVVQLSNAAWYLGEFDRALSDCNGALHPKIAVTVRKVVDLWEAGEKVLVFAFYRHTCRALRVHISSEIERRTRLTARRKLREAGKPDSDEAVARFVTRVQKRFFDDADSPARRLLNAALVRIVDEHEHLLNAADVSGEQRTTLVDIMRRFLRVETTLARCFPVGTFDDIEPEQAIAEALDCTDGSGVSWKTKFADFIMFLARRCTTEDRELFIQAAQGTRTGGIRVDTAEEDDDQPEETGSTVTVANVQVATGRTKRDTRARLMRAFNTPFFPDIFVCSQVMSEGVDLQRHCRHVIHHDLAWNPSSIEQRTGRVDRVGCKAEGRHPIDVFLPYLSGAADERQYRVMSEREQWFRVVMGQDEVAKLITPESGVAVALPNAISEALTFNLGLAGRAVAEPRPRLGASNLQ